MEPNKILIQNNITIFEATLMRLAARLADEQDSKSYALIEAEISDTQGYLKEEMEKLDEARG